jgi:hypothetical protein
MLHSYEATHNFQIIKPPVQDCEIGVHEETHSNCKWQKWFEACVPWKY